MIRLAIPAAVIVCAAAGVAEASGASSGPPPPPTSTNGNAVETVAAGGGLATPTSFAFGDGQVFEGDGGDSQGSAPPNGGVFVLSGGKGAKLPGSPAFVAGLAWHSNALFVSAGVLTKSGASFQILKWSGWNGTTFKSHSVVWKAPKKLNGLNGLGFGANGRLYVGVDVGLTDNNDHGPASLSPDLYDILSMTSTGKQVKVFATGMRQPWQMAFPTGSSSPFVSDLGQDKGAKNPPDFVLRVKAGQNYGFPKCNWTKASACGGYAKPFRKFSPHTNVMGLAISGGRLYMSEFTGNQGKTGLVVSMPLSGKGKVTTLLTGFSAPVVGLAIHGGYLYAGSLTAQVFRVKL